MGYVIKIIINCYYSDPSELIDLLMKIFGKILNFNGLKKKS
ncbi:hypothetical protein CBM2637_B110097 [Cupriavidus taiwanensis]|nr:hypothetical protein CBM2637_B110097 [Cupriavidus taiwanensis]